MKFVARLFSGGMVAFAALLLAGCSDAASPSREGDAGTGGAVGPVVLAASSMQGVLEDVATAWELQGHAPVQLSFASSAALARQIESGAPADVFISADLEWMDYLQKRGALAPQGAVTIATNSLVLVGPATGEAVLAANQLSTPAHDLARIRASVAALGKGRLAMGDPASVPAGRYGKAALIDLGLWDGVEAKVVPAENVRAALAFVARGEADLGIVYASDAKAAAAVRTISRFPETSHPAIVYPTAVLARSRSDEAQGFVAYLSSAEARALFSSHGFGLPAQ